VIFHAVQFTELGAKTTRSAYATPRSNAFLRFPGKLPLSGSCPA